MKKTILILSALLITTSVAFATQQARSVFQSAVTSTITDGGALTAAELRTILTNLSDSTFFLSDNDADDISDASTTNKFVTAADITKLSNLSGTNTGDQTTIAALTSNGANCAAGQVAAGVDASGASEGCVDVWTEAENTSAGYISATLTQEQVEDYIGGMVTGNTETNIAVTYQDIDGTLDFVVSGGGAVDSVNTQTGAVVLDADDIDDTATLHKFVTAADLTNLSNLSGTNTGDQVIPTNVSDLTNDSGFLTAITNSTQINAGVIDETDLDVSTNASLDLADSSVQPGDNISTLTNNSGYITDYTVTELDVTTHEAALSIADTQITGLTLNDLTFDVGSVSKTEFGYLNGVTSNLQTQINAIDNSTISWQVSGFIETASEKDYTVILNSEYDITITNITTKSSAGTCTLTGKINATSLGGTANSVSSAETSQAHASLNTLTAGDDLIMTISANSACLNVAFTISGTRSTS